MEKTIIQIQQNQAEDTKLLRVAAYARVSCGKDTMLHSLVAQIDYYRKLILNSPAWAFAGVYADEAKTGTKEDRPEFQNMLNNCRKGEIDMVITKSISRFARNTVTLLKIIRELRGLGIDVFFEEQNIHTMSADGEVMLTLLASFAQAESLSVSENCKWRIRSGFEKGQTTPFRILGYNLVDGEIVVVEDEVEIVKRIFNLYLQGYGTSWIAKTLNKEKAPTLNGGKWRPSTIASILSNEKYCGDLLLQKKFIQNHISKKPVKNTGQLPQYFIEDNHEAIIDKDTFIKVSAERQRRSIKRTTPFSFSDLTGKIHCSCCGKNYRRKTTARCMKWVCATFNSKGKQFCPDSKMIPEETIYNAICNVLNLEEYSSEIFSNQIDYIDACPGNLLRFHFREGTKTDYIWKDRSRAESWTDEMKETARQKTLRRQNYGRKESTSYTSD